MFIPRVISLCVCSFLTSVMLNAQDTIGVLADSEASFDETSSSNVASLELAGNEAFEYDIDNKIRKAKSSVLASVGINFTQNNNTNTLQVNASVALGYSYFFHKTFGVRLQGIFDNALDRYYGAMGIDVLWDFVQTEPFGLGIFVGSSVGYQEEWSGSRYGGFVGQIHTGISMVFDGGRSRLEGIARIPYNTITEDKNIASNITYIIMYSYTF